MVLTFLPRIKTWLITCAREVKRKRKSTSGFGGRQRAAELPNILYWQYSTQPTITSLLCRNIVGMKSFHCFFLCTLKYGVPMSDCIGSKAGCKPFTHSDTSTTITNSKMSSTVSEELEMLPEALSYINHRTLNRTALPARRSPLHRDWCTTSFPCHFDAFLISGRLGQGLVQIL